ncbi:MAG: NADH-quinone oxidoreductase subunit NuoE [bacterium]
MPQKAEVENTNDGLLDVRKIDEIIDRFPRVPSSLMTVLQEIQIEYKYLPREALIAVAGKMGVPLSRVYNVATFYNAFSLIPRGRHIIHVCMGTACHVRGAAKILDELERILGIKAGETTEDMKFTLESVNCLGACALGPVMVIDGEYFGKVTPEKISSILKMFDENT